MMPFDGNATEFLIHFVVKLIFNKIESDGYEFFFSKILVEYAMMSSRMLKLQLWKFVNQF